MYRVFVLTVALLGSLLIATMLQGCGDSGVARAAGTYEIDKAAIKAELQKEIDKIEDPNEKYMTTTVLQGIDSMPSMTFTLGKDGTLEATTVVMGMTDTAKGNWSISGSTVTFRMTETGANDPDEMTGTLKGDRIELNALEGEDMPFRMIFKRKKA